MKMLWIFALAALTTQAFAAYTTQCDAQYEQCMSNCCSRCNATLGMENDRPVCWFWATKNLDRHCMDFCSPCTAEYAQCAGTNAGYGNGSATANGTAQGNPNGSIFSNSIGSFIPAPAQNWAKGCIPSFVLLGVFALAAKYKA